ELTLPEQEMPNGFERSFAALPGIQTLPLRIINRKVQEPEESGQSRPQRVVERHQLVGDLLANPPFFVLGLDLEVLLYQIDDGQVWGRLPVGSRAALKDEPADGPGGAEELPEQARLAHPRLTDDRQDLTVTITRAFQGVTQGLQLGVTAHEAGEAPGGCGLQSRTSLTGAGQDEHLDRAGESLDRRGPEWLRLHEALGQPER